MIAPVLAMESTSAASWRDGLSFLESSFDLQEVFTGFEIIDRFSCSDGDQSISRAERAHMVDTHITQLRTTCVLHRLANDREEAMAPMRTTTQTIKHLVLSILKGGNKKTLRKAIKRVFVRKALRGIIRDRMPSSGQRQCNEKLMFNFIDRKMRRDKVAAVSICANLPGNWDDVTAVELFPPPDETDKCACRKSLKRYSDATLSKMPDSFPSSKWQKTRSSLDLFGRLLPHGILYDGFIEFFFS